MKTETTYKTRRKYTKQEQSKIQIIINKRQKKDYKLRTYNYRTNPEIKFAYVDVNGNLKICLHKKRVGKYMFPFISIDRWPLLNDYESDDEDF